MALRNVQVGGVISGPPLTNNSILSKPDVNYSATLQAMNLITPRPWEQLLHQHPNCLRTLSRGVRGNQGLALGFLEICSSALERVRVTSGRGGDLKTGYDASLMGTALG